MWATAVLCCTCIAICCILPTGNVIVAFTYDVSCKFGLSLPGQKTFSVSQYTFYTCKKRDATKIVKKKAKKERFSALVSEVYSHGHELMRVC